MNWWEIQEHEFPKAAVGYCVRYITKVIPHGTVDAKAWLLTFSIVTT